MDYHIRNLIKSCIVFYYICSVSRIITNLGLIGLNNYGAREVAYSRSEQKKLDKVFADINILRFVGISLEEAMNC